MIARRIVRRAFAAALALLLASATVPVPAQQALPAGADRLAFTRTFPGLDAAARRDAALGARLFLLDWPIAPGTEGAPGGLGPTYARVSCAACHPRNGRGQPPGGPEAGPAAMVVRLSVPGSGPQGGPNPHPAYGDQLNPYAIPGVPAEGRAMVRWEEIEGAYADGTPYRLRRPVVAFRDLAFGPLGADIRVSLRIAPALAGLGLLEAVPEDALIALAARQAAETPATAGRLNLVWDPGAGALRPGRFGWKANVADLRAQAAVAAHQDIGLTSLLYPAEDCPPVQRACGAAPTGATPDLDAANLARLTLYLRSLDAPPRRTGDRAGAGDDPAVVRGAALFEQIGCAACHLPTLVTGPSATAPWLANQTFHPYTDLLLHDLGDGLADDRPDFAASGREWRTAPLWGLGVGAAVAGNDALLHDGRARGAAEAILWHGGQAEFAGNGFRHLSEADRAALLAYLGLL